MTVLFLKYVPRKYKLGNAHLSCSGENATETRGGARNQDSPQHELTTVCTHTTPPHRTAALQDASICYKDSSSEKLQLGLKTDWWWLVFFIQNKFVKKSSNGLF